MQKISDVIKYLQSQKKQFGNLYVRKWSISDEEVTTTRTVLSKTRKDGYGQRKSATTKEFAKMVEEIKKGEA